MYNFNIQTLLPFVGSVYVTSTIAIPNFTWRTRCTQILIKVFISPNSQAAIVTNRVLHILGVQYGVAALEADPNDVDHLDGEVVHHHSIHEPECATTVGQHTRKAWLRRLGNGAGSYLSAAARNGKWGTGPTRPSVMIFLHVMLRYPIQIQT